MGVEGRVAVIKYIIFTFNLIFCLCSLCLIAIGALMLSNTGAVVTDVGTVASLGVMAVGLITFLVSFFGCCGAQRESYCMVATFSALMFFIFFVEVGVGITAYFFRHQVHAGIKDEVWELLRRHPEASEEDPMGKLQIALKCCGVNAYDDWFHYHGNSTVPDSCCVNRQKHCGENLEVNYNIVIHTAGCMSVVEALLQRNAMLLGGVAIGLALMQIIAIILACCLMKGISDFHKYDMAELELCPPTAWSRQTTFG